MVPILHHSALHYFPSYPRFIPSDLVLTEPVPKKPHDKLTFPQDQIHTHGDDEDGHEAKHNSELMADRGGRVVGNLAAFGGFGRHFWIVDSLPRGGKIRLGSESRLGRKYAMDSKGSSLNKALSNK